MECEWRNPEQIPLRCHLNFHCSCSQRFSCERKRRTHSVQAVSFKCTQHGSAQTNMVKWGVFLVFCVVYPSWNRSDEELLPALPGEAEWDWMAPDLTAGSVFCCYVGWRKVMTAEHTYLNPKISLCYCMSSGQLRYSWGCPTSRGEMYCDVIFAQRKVQLLSTSLKAL